MQVTTITAPSEEIKPREHWLTEEELNGELSFYIAENMTEKLLKAGLITEEQYGQIMAENRRVFRPFLWEIL